MSVVVVDRKKLLTDLVPPGSADALAFKRADGAGLASFSPTRSRLERECTYFDACEGERLQESIFQ